MKNPLYTCTLFLVLTGCSTNPAINEVQNSSPIRFNSLGFAPESPKTVTITGEHCRKILIRNTSDSTIAFKAKARGPYTCSNTGVQFWKADFSGLQNTGSYVVEVPGVAVSAPFNIENDIYRFPYVTAMRAFYLWRCGTEVLGTHCGDTFWHAACHTNDGYWHYAAIGNKHTNGTGGWHDAGDYGKYTVNASITLANLFMAWEFFGEKLIRIGLDIPLSEPALPEFLSELKWETDFLLKMEYPDGSGRISHKLTGLSFEPFVMPEFDTAKRYFTKWSSAATAHYAAVMAMAARYFQPYDSNYAKTCLKASIRSYNYLAENPAEVHCDMKEFSTGAYQAGDSEPRMWAAAELWETTGDARYLADFETRAAVYQTKIDLSWDWDNVKNLGMYTYLLSKRNGRNTRLFGLIKTSLVQVADSIVNNTRTDAFGRPFNEYYWGCNGTIARLSLTLAIANKQAPDKKWLTAAHEISAHLFGKNIYARSFITGLGINPPMFPHDRRSGADNVAAPWPGYIVGGGHTPNGWLDEEDSYSTNEIAINWQAPLVFLLAWLAVETNGQ